MKSSSPGSKANVPPGIAPLFHCACGRRYLDHAARTGLERTFQPLAAILGDGLGPEPRTE
ncbi:MAG TPA: hypothetical protein VJS65_07960 [Verrucomicrobiae bacterium]|nr:hypothetical protein [Verrucomicrobiae bacterium]